MRRRGYPRQVNDAAPASIKKADTLSEAEPNSGQTKATSTLIISYCLDEGTARAVGSGPKNPGWTTLVDASLVLMEACSLHSTLRFHSLHKGVPYKTRSQVLSHQQDDSSVDPNHIGVIPVLERIECVYEPVFSPGRRVAGSDRLQNAHGSCRQERQ